MQVATAPSTFSLVSMDPMNTYFWMKAYFVQLLSDSSMKCFFMSSEDLGNTKIQTILCNIDFPLY